jgi:hypothetical protein
MKTTMKHFFILGVSIVGVYLLTTTEFGTLEAAQDFIEKHNFKEKNAFIVREV